MSTPQTQVFVTQRPQMAVVTVATPGPEGQPGPQGPQGPATPATDASMVTYLPLGGVLTTVAAKLAQTVSVLDFGVEPTGVMDSTAATQAALNSVVPGSRVVIPNGVILRIAGNLTIPSNVTLWGPQSYVGTMTANSMSAPYHTMGGALHVSSGATITMNAGSCIDGVLLTQDGLTFPQTTPAGYAGTAITYAGDDCTVKNSMIIGFSLGITSFGFQRPRAFDLLMDNLAGIVFNGSEDVTDLNRVHMWPFGTFYSGVTATNIQRSGTGVSIISDGSGAKLIDCFTFGYNTGFATNGTGDVGQTFLNCWADSTGAYGTGFSITGGATDTKLTACQSSGNISGYFFNMTGGLKTSMTDCNSWGNSTHGINVGAANAGDLLIRGGYLRNNSNAISVASASGIVDIDEVAFDNSNGIIFNISVTTTLLRIGANCNFGNEAAGTQLIGTPANVTLPSVASATVLTVPDTGNDFLVTGTTGVTSMIFGYAGRQVTLYFAGVLTVTSATGSYNQIRLNGGSNFTSAAGSTLTLKHNGVQWYEIGRAA